MTQTSEGLETKSRLLDRLVATVQELPTEKIIEVSDFADHLRLKLDTQRLTGGSAQTILQAVALDGPLAFGQNGLGQLFTEIEQMRAIDLEEYPAELAIRDLVPTLG